MRNPADSAKQRPVHGGEKLGIFGACSPRIWLIGAGLVGGVSCRGAEDEGKTVVARQMPGSDAPRSERSTTRGASGIQSILEPDPDAAAPVAATLMFAELELLSRRPVPVVGVDSDCDAGRKGAALLHVPAV